MKTKTCLCYSEIMALGYNSHLSISERYKLVPRACNSALSIHTGINCETEAQQ